MSTALEVEACSVCIDDAQFPNEFVIRLSGICCKCGEAGKRKCGCCRQGDECSDCDLFSDSFNVKRVGFGSLVYERLFTKNDFGRVIPPCDVESLSLCLQRHEKDDDIWYSACVVLKFSSESGKRPVSWRRAKVSNCCNVGRLRKHTSNRQCHWPDWIEVNGTPTVDYVTPPPEWSRGSPDDLNDSPFWPSLDMPLAQDSGEVPVRIANGELQLRIKDVGADGYGAPWGHTRIYSNRLSNSFDFGNGTNWLIHECPRLVRFTTSKATVTRLHELADGYKPTGCTVMLLRGTRNALWFDEIMPPKGDRYWKPRFGAKHSLEHDGAKDLTFTLTAPNAHIWEFYDFTDCHSNAWRRLPTEERRIRAPGQFKSHKLPGGQTLTARYLNGRLQSSERVAANREDQQIAERFSYDYIKKGSNKGRIEFVTHSRGSVPPAGTPADAPLAMSLRRAVYTYYEANEPFGNLGDLKTVTHEAWDPDSSSWKHRPNSIHYYRYHKQSNSTYCQGLLHLVIGPETYNFLDGLGVNVMEFPSSSIAKFADLEVEYYEEEFSDLARRVKRLTMFGTRTHYFSYRDGPSFVWNSTTVEERPDGAIVEYFCNSVGQTTRQDLIDPKAKRRWTQAWEFDRLHHGLAKRTESWELKYGEPLIDANTGQTPYAYGLRYYFSYTPGSKAYLNGVSVWDGVGEENTPLKAFTYRRMHAKHSIVAVDTETSYGVANYEFSKEIGRPSRSPHALGVQPTAESNSLIAYGYVFDASGFISKRTTTLPRSDQAHFAGAEKYDPHTTRGVIVEEFDRFGNAVVITDPRETSTTIAVDVITGGPISKTVTPNGAVTPSDSLVYDFTPDMFGRITEALGPEHLAIIPGENEERSVRTATWYVYRELEGEVWTAQGYLANGVRHCINPVLIDRYDRAGRTTDSIAAVRIDSRPPQRSEDSNALSWTRWVQRLYLPFRDSIRTRVYDDIPAKRFSETVMSSDIARRERIIEYGGQGKYVTLFDARGLPLKIQSSNGGPLGTLFTLYYDRDEPNANNGADKPAGGSLTKVIRESEGEEPRVTEIKYDIRSRMTEIVEAGGGIVSYSYTNQGQVDGIQRKNGPRLASRAQLIDHRGRVVETQLNGYTSTGKDLERLYELTLYDNANQIVAVEPQGRVNNHRPIIRLHYDGFGRLIRQESGREETGTRKFDVYADTSTTFNRIGEPLLVTSRGRYPDAFINGTTFNGTLSGSAPGPPTPSRASTVGIWFDALGRKLGTAEFGDKPAAFVRPALAKLAEDVPLTRYEYGPAGNLSAARDAGKDLTQYRFDHAGRLTVTARNLPESLWHVLDKRQFSLDVLGRVADDVSVIQQTYGLNNRVAATTSLNNTTGTQSTKFGYESRMSPDAITDVIDPDDRHCNRCPTRGDNGYDGGRHCKGLQPMEIATGSLVTSEHRSIRS